MWKAGQQTNRSKEDVNYGQYYVIKYIVKKNLYKIGCHFSCYKDLFPWVLKIIWAFLGDIKD